MIVTWTEYAGGKPVAVSDHAPAGPVCIIHSAVAGDAVLVGFSRVTAMRHEDALAVLGSVPKTGREVARELGVSPSTANARLNDLRDWGMAQSSAAGKAIMWTLADGAAES